MTEHDDIYVALLRAVNVGGRRVLMADLRAAVEEAGFDNVRSYIQTGNLCVRSRLDDSAEVADALQDAIRGTFGLESAVMVRTLAEMRDLLLSSPFARSGAAADEKRYVSFLERPPTEPLSLPVRSEKDGLELFAVEGRQAYCLSRPVKGRYGFPNTFVEKELGLVATTRNWSTVEKMCRKWGLTP